MAVDVASQFIKLIKKKNPNLSPTAAEELVAAVGDGSATLLDVITTLEATMSGADRNRAAFAQEAGSAVYAVIRPPDVEKRPGWSNMEPAPTISGIVAIDELEHRVAPRVDAADLTTGPISLMGF